MKTGSRELMRDINNNLVLESIIELEPISRANISKELGLTKATISSIVQDLLDQNLVIEVGSGKSNLGRKPTMLEFNNLAGYTCCIDLGVNTISVMFTDLLGNKVYCKDMENAEVDKKDIIKILKYIIDLGFSSLPNSHYGMVGITLGIHGIVDNNTIIFTPYYDLTELDLVKELEKIYNAPVYLHNEANLSVLGEKAFSNNVENIANISIHSGIGLGLVLNDKLYQGYNGYAGEFGHTIIEMDGLPCPCGNKGCIEQYASQRAMLNLLADKKGVEKITFDNFVSLYENKDADAIEVVNQFIKVIAIGISNLLNVFNPEILIINSAFLNKFPHILDDIKMSLSSKVSHYNDIVVSSLQDESILYGGAYINIINFLKIKHFRPRVKSLE